MAPGNFTQQVTHFKLTPKGKATVVSTITVNGQPYPVYTNAFWTHRQRQAHSLHEISYRACFKPQLPGFFIERFTQPGDTVYDPFNGRGTTIIEAALHGRNVVANDVNPLSLLLSKPRLQLPTLQQVEERLSQLPTAKSSKADINLRMFYHPKTERELVALRHYLLNKRRKDYVDHWIQMVATNRLTGHSSGFFSVYTLPPNQAVSAERQVKINRERKQKPEYRDVKKLILKKSKQLLRDATPATRQTLSGVSCLALNTDAALTHRIPPNSVSLTVTSPPFLDIVQYAQDNWLRCWFNGIDHRQVQKKITMSRTIEEWAAKMQKVFLQLYRITRPGGMVAFEVGEVRNGKIKLEEAVVPLGLNAGFTCLGILINNQRFTKTANIWGVNNNRHGTNSNRIVVFQKQ